MPPALLDVTLDRVDPDTEDLLEDRLDPWDGVGDLCCCLEEDFSEICSTLLKTSLFVWSDRLLLRFPDSDEAVLPTARADSKLPFQLQRSSSFSKSDIPELEPEWSPPIMFPDASNNCPRFTTCPKEPRRWLTMFPGNPEELMPD